MKRGKRKNERVIVSSQKERDKERKGVREKKIESRREREIEKERES